MNKEKREFNLKVLVDVYPDTYKRDKDGKKTLVSGCVRCDVKGMKENYKQWLYEWHFNKNREDDSIEEFEKYLKSYALFYIYDELGIESTPLRENKIIE